LDQSRNEIGHVRPSFLPDGNHFLFVARGASRETSTVFVGSLDSGQRKPLMASDTKAVFANPGYVLFGRDASLMAQQFDPRRIELHGDPVVVAEDLGTNAGAQAGFSVSDTGLLVYRPGSSRATRQLTLLDRDGRQFAFAGTPASFQNPIFSPDGQTIAVNRLDEGNDIWLIKTATGAMSRLTSGPDVEDHPVWSPDGTQIVFSSARGGSAANIYQRSIVRGTERLVLESVHSKIPLSWSTDGRYLVYEDRDPKSGSDLWVLSMSGERTTREFLRTSFNESQAQFSPNGHWIAYVSDESGRPEVYVQSFPSTGQKWQVSTNGAQQPRWRADGKELFFLGLFGVKDFMAVEVLTKPSAGLFRTTAPRQLFRFDVLTLNQRNSYDLTRGDAFLLNVIPRATAMPNITVLVNWFKSLKK
jgi:eukaryotic-like serine/threonine-protein kinase